MRTFAACCAIVGLCALALLLGAHAADSANDRVATDRVVIDTSRGAITIELYAKQAPASVANFLRHVDAGFYSGLVFHRVMADFVIQTGGYDVAMHRRQPLGGAPNESRNGLHNVRGAVAMARLDDPNSATSQFFIDVSDNPSLDALGARPGYTVFGRVVAGIEVVDAIAAAETGTRDGLDDVPLEPIVVKSIKRVTDRPRPS
jgi:peptidyl-prolyl cis-trans isomerase A (cyclophilin A)